jgi:hypothetical protein
MSVMKSVSLLKDLKLIPGLYLSDGTSLDYIHELIRTPYTRSSLASPFTRLGTLWRTGFLSRPC